MLSCQQFHSLLPNSYYLFSRRGDTDLPAQGGGMMSGGGSSLNGILETEKVKRERFVSTVTIHRPQYKATYTETFSCGRRLAWKSKKSTVGTGRKVGAEEKEGRYGQMKGGYISR